MNGAGTTKTSRLGHAVLSSTLALVLATLVVLAGVSPVLAAPPRSAAPHFSGTTLDGQAVSLESYHGKPLVLLFWGSW